MTKDEFIKQHNYINYCEAVIAPDGDVEYALPGHVYKLAAIAEESQDELDNMMPMRAAPLYWLVEHTKYASVWYNQFILPHGYTGKQIETLQALCDAGIIASHCSGITSVEKTNCDIIENFEKTDDEALFDTMLKSEHITIIRKA